MAPRYLKDMGPVFLYKIGLQILYTVKNKYKYFKIII